MDEMDKVDGMDRPESPLEFSSAGGVDLSKPVRYAFVPACLLAGFLLALNPFDPDFFFGWKWSYVLGLSFMISFCLTPLCGRLAFRFRALDFPDDRKSHVAATPLLGGMAVFAAILLAVLKMGMMSPKLGAILAASFLLTVAGVLDDVREVSAGKKLAVQAVCTALVMAFGLILNTIPKSLGILSSVGNGLLTVFWIIGITNAMNFFDGMDGLAAGVGAIIAFFLAVTAFHTDQETIGWLSLATMGACLGFLPYNLRPQKNAAIFLGDAGSTVIGFVLACIAVFGNWADDQPVVSMASPLLIFWVLIFDMVHISADRILTGKVKNFRQWIEYVGKDHLHHRLAMVTGSKKKSVLFIYLLSACLGISALALRNASAADALLLLLQAIFFVILITILERRGRRLAEECNNREPTS